MPISSSAVVHLTHTKDNLLGILSENFKLKFCKEALPFKTGGFIRVPMVSFCDIPFSQIKDHKQKYGEYGIGLTKEWAIRNRLNPVLYVEPKSMLAESYDSALQYFHEFRREDILTGMAYRHLLDFLRYMKPYQGDLVRKSGTTPDYMFYDEREWRYVPSVDDCDVMHYMETDFDDLSIESEANVSIEKIRLKFEIADIKYILIKSDNDIHDFMVMLKSFSHRYTNEDIELLATRIMICQNIIPDF